MALTYAQFVAQKGREDRWLFEFTDDAGTAHRYSYPSEFATSPSESPASTLWRNLAGAGYDFVSPLVDPLGGGWLEPDRDGRLLLLNKGGNLESLIGRDLEGREIVIRHGGECRRGRLAYADYRTLRTARLGSPLYDLLQAELPILPASDRLTGDLEDRVLRGGDWCLEGDGAVGYVSFGDATAAAKCLLGGTLTFQTWKMVYDLSHANVLLSWGSGANSPFDIRIQTDGSIRFYANSGSVSVSTAAGAIATEGLYHIAVVVTATTIKFRVYNFATRAVTNTTSTGSYGSRPTTPAGNLNLFRDPSTASGFFEGWVDAVRLSNVEWTDAEIDEARFRPLTTSEKADSSLKLNLDCNDGFGPTLADTSPSPITGAVNGTTTLTSAATLSAKPPISGNYFGRTSGSFVTDGYAIGDRIVISGWTGDYVQNNGDAIVAKVEASALYITGRNLKSKAATAGISIARYGDLRWVPSLSGGEDVAGVVYPNLFGSSEQFPGIRVDARLNVYLLFVNKASAIDAVREGLSLRTPATAHTTWRAFVGALADSLASGTLPDPGWETLVHSCGTYAWSTNPPVLAVTFGAHGDASGSGYVFSAADITRRVVCTRGDQPFTDPTELDTGAFTTLNAAALGTATLADVAIDGYVSERISVADYIARILGSVGAFAWTSRADGKLTVRRFEGAGVGSSVETFTSDDLIGGPQGCKAVGGIDRVADVLLGYRPNWQVLNLGDIAEDMKGDDLVRFATEPWRWAPGSGRVGLTSAGIQKKNGLKLETYIVSATHARDEAVRRRTLFSTKPQVLEITVPLTEVQIDVFDELIFHAFEPHFATGVQTDRLNTTSTTQFLALSVTENTKEGNQTVRIYRQNEAA